jgi:putative endonuclease
MDDHRKPLGDWGEETAIRFLRRSGYRILDRKFRAGKMEIDIVASDGGTLVFVEVKTRRRRGRIPPFLSVDPRKQSRIVRVARAWLARKTLPPGTEVRFDVVSIVVAPDGPPNVEHLVDAFRPR